MKPIRAVAFAAALILRWLASASLRHHLF